MPNYVGVPTIFWVIVIRFSSGDIFEECQGIDNKEFIPSPDGCEFFIFCNGKDSWKGDCPDGDYFDNKKKTCDQKDTVTCAVGNQSKVEILPTTSSLSSTTIAASSTIVSSTTFPTALPSTNLSAVVDTITSQIIPFATSTISSLTSEITKTVLNSTSNELTTIAAVASTSDIIKVTVSSSNICPDVDIPNEVVLLPHQQSCSDYFVCLAGKRMEMRCAPTLHFDAATGRCDYAEKVHCLRGVTAREQCRAHTVDLFPHETNCNYYYRCSSGYLLLQQCSRLFAWDYQRRTCVQKDIANCLNKKF